MMGREFIEAVISPETEREDNDERRYYEIEAEEQNENETEA